MSLGQNPSGHPSEKDLILFSSGDLNPVETLRVRWHLRSCAQCDSELNSARALTSALRRHANTLPAGLEWDRLAAEMTANIHLGLEAGECVGPVRAARSERIGWRASMVMASMTVVLVAAWWLNPPRGREGAVHTAAIEMGTSPGAIELKENGSTLMLLHTRGQQSPIIVSTPGSLRARFVDQDTGQVTINNVYSD